MVPAQLTQPSRALDLSTVAVIQALRAEESVTSTRVEGRELLGEIAVIWDLAVSKREALMSEMEMARDPRRVSSRAVARPMPEAAPVIAKALSWIDAIVGEVCQAYQQYFEMGFQSPSNGTTFSGSENA